MNYGLALIRAIVSGKTHADRLRDFTYACDKGVSTKTLGSVDGQVWTRITNYTEQKDTFRKIPTVELVQSWFPSVELPATGLSVEELVKSVVESYVSRSADSYFIKYHTDSKINPTTALETLATRLRELLAVARTSDSRFLDESSVGEWAAEILHSKSNKGLIGHPYPWDCLNEATGGMLDGQLIVVYGLPKSMKTWVSLYMANHAWEAGRRVMIFSKEMSYELLRNRLLCIRARLDYSVMRGTVEQDVLEDSYCKLVEQINKSQNSMILVNSIRTVQALRSEVERIKPDVLMLDSAYQLGDGGDGSKAKHERMNDVSTAFKEMAVEYKLPIIAVYQENESRALEYKNSRGTVSFAGSSAVLQDVDLAIRAVLNTHKEEISLHLPAAREVNFKGFSIHAKPAVDFSFAGLHLWPIGWTPEAEKSVGKDSTAKLMSLLKKTDSPL